MSENTVDAKNRKKEVIDWIKKWQKPLLVAFTLIFVWPFYLIINYYYKYTSPTAANLSMWIDEAVPYMPAWEYIYISVYTFVIFPAVYIKSNPLFRRVFYAFVALQFAAFLIFLAYPTHIARPFHLVQGERTFVEWGVHTNYHIDPPYNCFPSLHVGNAYLASFAIMHVDPVMGLLTFLWATAISFSTLAVEHHYFYDIIGGLALALLTYFAFIFPQRKEGQPREELRRHRAYLLIPIAAFLLIVLVAYISYMAGLSFNG